MEDGAPVTRSSAHRGADEGSRERIRGRVAVLVAAAMPARLAVPKGGDVDPEAIIVGSDHRCHGKGLRSSRLTGERHCRFWKGVK
jgi:hypothetical protein